MTSGTSTDSLPRAYHPPRRPDPLIGASDRPSFINGPIIACLMRFRSEDTVDAIKGQKEIVVLFHSKIRTLATAPRSVL